MESYRYIPNSGVQEIFFHHLHDVEVVAGIARFIPVSFRKDGDEVLGEPPCHILMPSEEVGPAIALTWQRMPSGVIIPAVGHLVRQVMRLH